VDVNNSGLVVGTSWQSNTGPGDSFVYELASGEMDFIAFPGAALTSVSGINDRGQIVGSYYTGDDEFNQFGFLATPVPEPATFALVLAGLAWLSMRKRSRG
jgi:uncharacterized membrane protein